MSSDGLRRGMSITVILIGVFISAVDMLIVNIAFPSMQESFPSAGLTSLSWVMSAYAITFAALLLPSGRWADRSGRKRVFLLGLGLFTAVSAVCAAAPSLEVLVAFRALQGVGAALMAPSSLGLLLGLFAPERRGIAIGLWTAVGGVGSAAALPLGGLLAEIDWRWVFVVNLPLGTAALLIGAWSLRRSAAEGGPVPDLLGIAVLAASVAAVVATIAQGQSWGWGSPQVIGLSAVGVVGLAYTVRRALRHPAPVIEPAILAVRNVALGNVATGFFFMGVGAMAMSTILFLTQVWGHSTLRGALEIAPGPVAATVFAVPSGILAVRYGVHLVGLAGATAFAAGGIWWACVLDGTPDFTGHFLPGSVIGGIGFGAILPALAAASTLSLPPERVATGTGMASMSRQIGMALGVAVVAAVLAGTPDLSSFRAAFLIMAGASLVSGLALFAVGPVRRPAPAGTGEDAQQEHMTQAATR
ncbi:MFS transporter [Streptomyces sp. NRRL S-118]|uniref:MFS transporter n=1 Tax=Streptomyces sp. NRRL S-118 TaxID=1463881 RepID=UPI00099C2DF6|nr:MFS transporter [Streptomyces sp. NRRL S-118]